MSHLNCAILTFNCGREPVKPAVFARHIAKYLENGPEHDLIVFSLQEISPLSYGFIGGHCLSYYYKKLHEALTIATGLDTYVNIFVRNIGITATLLYVHQDRQDRVNSIGSGSVGLGWLEMGNKGAVGVKLSWIASSSKSVDLTFVAAHLAPHEQGLERRNQDWMHIVQRLVFQSVWSSNPQFEASEEDDNRQNLASATAQDEDQPLLKQDATLKLSRKDETKHTSTVYQPASYTFVAGDLNYRTSDNSPRSDDYGKYPKFSNSSDTIKNLLDNDQLNAQRKHGNTLHGFQEAPIDFPPTYKYTSKSQKEAAEKEKDKVLAKPVDDSPVSLGYALHRWPSYCDRILYLQPDGRQAPVKNNFYRSLPLMSTSDHQPVMASFSIPLETISSITDHGINEYLAEPPYAVDPLWMERFATARRREFILGLLAYLGTTWEGNSILLAILVGAAGVYFTSKFGWF